MRSLILHSNIDLTLVDPLMVFRVTPWRILFPFLNALGASHPLVVQYMQAVDEVCTCMLYKHTFI